MNLFKPEQPDPHILEQLNQILEQVTTGRVVQNLPQNFPLSVDPAQNQLIKNVLTLARQYNESFNFLQDLARGKLDTAPPIRNYFSNPFKNLHSELLHLTWQIQQIAKGDYEQKVSFSGDFSDAINSMIQILQQKEDLDKMNRENEIKLQKYADELADLNNKLTKLSITDALTGALNRRQFDVQMEHELQRSQRFGKTFSLVMFDIDHFKQFNDCYGHPAGDKVLISICQFVKNEIRQTDRLYRYGGEEFTIILPETDLRNASFVTEKLRKHIAQTNVEYQGNSLPRITASFGVASYSQQIQEPAQLIHAADKALYHAKNSGRNCVKLFEDNLVI
ncbi:MAG: GGDEF domain-containing protein [Tolumonas sp.]|nr:GGDEF domain-containing protein [Tolumonas sp.]